MSYTKTNKDVITFNKGMLGVKIFTNREKMGKEAAINVSSAIQKLLK